MPTDAAILTLSQWLSPAYPVGAYAYSHGLEWLVESGAVRDAASFDGWLREVLEHGAGQADARFLVAAFRARGADELRAVDDTCRAFAASLERRQEADRQGAAFCAVTARLWGLDLPPRQAYPVAVGRAARLAGLPPGLTVRLFVQAFAATLAGAAMRLIPLGQTEGQAAIRRVQPLILKIADRAQAGSLDDLSSTVFLGDIAAMRHETQASRIFRT